VRPAPAFTPWIAGDAAVAGAFRMGLAPLDPSRWLPPADDVDRRRRERAAVLAERPEQALACPDDALPAARELAGLVLEATDRSGPVDAAAPLAQCADLVPDDLCLLDAGAPPRLRAGVLTAPSGWRLDARLGQDVRALHGPVAGLDPVLGARMRAFLERLPADRVFERGNWHFYDDDRYWRAEGDALARVPEAVRGTPAVAGHLFLRCERQTLRRLPGTGWLVFSIRVHVTPVSDLADHPRLAAALRDAIASLDATEARARRTDRIGAGLDAWLATVADPEGARCAG
jgi:hypothetical protein